MGYLHSFLLSNKSGYHISRSWGRWLFMAICGRILPRAGIVPRIHLAFAFNTPQLFSNYSECTHRRVWARTCATCQLRPFPKDVFALQSAYIPLHWVYLPEELRGRMRCCRRIWVIEGTQFVGGVFCWGIWSQNKIILGIKVIHPHKLCSNLHHSTQRQMLSLWRCSVTIEEAGILNDMIWGWYV